MTLLLRIALICASLILFCIVSSKIKKGKIRISDSVFWVLFALLLVCFALFPQVARFGAFVFGFRATSNFVFCAVIGILLIKVFHNSINLSLLNHKTEQLTQEIALLKDKLKTQLEHAETSKDSSN